MEPVLNEINTALYLITALYINTALYIITILLCNKFFIHKQLTETGGPGYRIRPALIPVERGPNRDGDTATARDPVMEGIIV